MRNPLRHERRTNGVAVQAFRKARGISQDMLATKCGQNDKGKQLSVGTVSKIESGLYQPSLDIMCRLANALEVDLDAITYVAAIYVPDEAARPVGVVTDAQGTAA